MVQRYRKACLKSMRHLLPESASLLEVLEARGGIEPPIKVLQTFALPLGDRASETATDPSILPDRESGITFSLRKGNVGAQADSVPPPFFQGFFSSFQLRWQPLLSLGIKESNTW